MKRARLLVVVALLAGCPGPKPSLLATGPDRNGVAPPRMTSALGFRLRDADDAAPADARRRVTASSPLADADTRKLVAKLPPAPIDPPKDVFVRDSSPPPPRAGKTITEPFPPPLAVPPPAPSTATGPLTVERRVPEGNVAIAPHVAITFSRPIVALGSIDPPVTTAPVLTPRPAGAWSWLGAETLVFQPEQRFAMATTFTVDVPGGTRAATGETLASRQVWTFTTPPPKIVRSHPGGKRESRSPLLFLELDQAIEPAAILGSLELWAGAERVALRLATPGEVNADDSVTRLVNAAEKNRWLAFRPVTRLAGAASYTVTLRAGAPSAEGPRRTEKDQTFAFTTHGAMKLERVACGEEESSRRTVGPAKCPPLATIRLDFSNLIDKAAFDPNAIVISPRPASVKVERGGSALFLHALTKGRTKYTLTVPPSLGDVHGQTLGEAQQVEVNVGSAEPRLFAAEQEMVVLAPSSPRAYTIYSVNEPSVRARVVAMRPEDWPAYLEWSRDRRKRALPGKVVVDRIIKPASAVDELVATPIPLDPALTQGVGQALVFVESTRAPTKDHPDRDEALVWIQSTQIGAAAFVAPDAVTGWLTNLADGSPLPGAELVLLGAGSATTDKDGLARIALGKQTGTLVYARKGADTALIQERWLGETKITRSVAKDRVRWLVYDDRGLYRPGEDVRLKGWVRRALMGVGGDLDRLDNVSSLEWTAKGFGGEAFAKGTAGIDADGSFDLRFHLPDNANQEDANVELSLLGAPDVDGAKTWHHVGVAEFRRPDFEVSARVSDGPHLSGGHAIVTADAKYYAGGGLAASKVEWSVRRETATFAPPNLREYRFGPDPELGRGDDDEPPRPVAWSGSTNAAGVHRLRVDFEPLELPVPMALAFEASIEDRNHQQWTARTSLLVHPASEYVGLRPAKQFLTAGDPLDVDVIVATIDGKRVERKVEVRTSRLEYDDDDHEREVEPANCETTTHCRFDTKEAGRYRIRAIVIDAEGRPSLTSTTVWVTGTSGARQRRLAESKVTLVPDSALHRPGDVARLLVVSPLHPAEGLLTVRRQGIVHLERFRMTNASHTLDVKLEDGHVPNVELRVDLVGARDGHPAWAGGAVPIKVLASGRELQLKATARSRGVEPGATTQIDVDVKDAAGKPVKDARVAVVVADEAVLALAEYRTPDPFDVFYAPRGIEVRELGMRERVILDGPPDPRRLAMLAGDTDADGIPDSLDKCPSQPETYNGFADDDGCPDRGRIVINEVTVADPKHINVRKNFSPLALFAPNVTTDGAGHASIPLKMPDNLTRYRIMTVASLGDRQFGSSESALTARLPLMLRASPPRFARFGDHFDVPVIVQNQTDAPLDAAVVARGANATVDGAIGARLVVPPNDRAEVRFSVTTARAGTARLQLAASAGAFTDASELPFPVYTPATTEAFATYGEVDQGAALQPVKLPPSALPDLGGLEITTSSTALQALTDAVLYLVRYPYECAEQIASRVLAVAALKDVLAAFQAEGLPSPATLIDSMKTDVERLERQQNASGGWSFWTGGTPWPFLSVHTMHALQRAQEKGFKVDPQVIASGRKYLAGIEQQIPDGYPPATRRAIVAYALYVRNRFGDPDPARARKLLAEPELSLEGVAWIWPTLARTAEAEPIRRLVANRVTETAGAAHFASGYRDGGYLLLHSDRRVDGLLLEAMIADQPSSTLIPKLVKGLLEHRSAGRWSTTQENAFVLLALDRYFHKFEGTTPDFVARVWLGDRYAGDHAFRGRTTDRARIAIPMRDVTSSDLTIAKDGPGRLYWRAAMQYAPADARVPPIDRGFVVTRRYEPVDRPDDVKRDQDGTWRIKAGARVRVRLTMLAKTRRYHVALVDPPPAGFEPMNPQLAVTGTIPQDPKVTDPHWYWSQTWYEHQNMRDDRVEAFASLLWDGVHEYVYVARATTAGTFAAPPPKAEEMYAPDTFGRGASERVIIAE